MVEQCGVDFVRVLNRRNAQRFAPDREYCQFWLDEKRELAVNLLRQNQQAMDIYEELIQRAHFEDHEYLSMYYQRHRRIVDLARPTLQLIDFCIENVHLFTAAVNQLG